MGKKTENIIILQVSGLQVAFDKLQEGFYTMNGIVSSTNKGLLLLTKNMVDSFVQVNKKLDMLEHNMDNMDTKIDLILEALNKKK